MNTRRAIMPPMLSKHGAAFEQWAQDGRDPQDHVDRLNDLRIHLAPTQESI